MTKLKANAASANTKTYAVVADPQRCSTLATFWVLTPDAATFQLLLEKSNLPVVLRSGRLLERLIAFERLADNGFFSQYI